MEDRSVFGWLGRIYLWLLPLKAAAALGLVGVGASLWLGPPGADRDRGPILVALGLALLAPAVVLVGRRRSVYAPAVNTADLHPKRFVFSLTVAQLRQLADELLTMEQHPHSGAVAADKQIERDRAGEQLVTHLSALIEDTRAAEPSARVNDSLPLLRASAKYLLTGCDRCRRAALRTALHAQHNGQPDAQEASIVQVRAWDDLMRQLSEQHGVSSPLRELVDPVAASPDDLAGLGLPREGLLGGEELLARF